MDYILPLRFYRIILFILILSCSSDVDYKEKINLANTFRAQGDLMNSIKLFNEIIQNNYIDENKQLSQFNIADIYMNEVKNYSYALTEFGKVLLYNIDNDTHKKSLFMYAYICSNYLDMYSDAFNGYNEFLKKYPNDDLISSVEYEINQLQPFIDEANKLRGE